MLLLTDQVMLEQESDNQSGESKAIDTMTKVSQGLFVVFIASIIKLFVDLIRWAYHGTVDAAPLPKQLSGQLETISSTFSSLVVACQGQLDFHKDMVIIKESSETKNYKRITDWTSDEMSQTNTIIKMIEKLSQQLDQLSTGVDKIADTQQQTKVKSFVATLTKFPPAMKKVFTIKKEVYTLLERGYTRMAHAKQDNLTPEEANNLKILIQKFNESGKLASQELKQFSQVMDKLK